MANSSFMKVTLLQQLLFYFGMGAVAPAFAGQRAGAAGPMPGPHRDPEPLQVLLMRPGEEIFEDVQCIIVGDVRALVGAGANLAFASGGANIDAAGGHGGRNAHGAGVIPHDTPDDYPLRNYVQPGNFLRITATIGAAGAVAQPMVSAVDLQSSRCDKLRRIECHPPLTELRKILSCPYFIAGGCGRAPAWSSSGRRPQHSSTLARRLHRCRHRGCFRCSLRHQHHWLSVEPHRGRNRLHLRDLHHHTVLVEAGWIATAAAPLGWRS